MAKKGYGSGEACLRKFARDNLARHQLGYLGEKIGRQVGREELKLKGIKGTPHKHAFDMLTKTEAWEVKTVSEQAKDIKMTCKGKQKERKIAWAKKNKKDMKSMLIVVNDKIDVYVRDGVGGFRPANMEHIGSFTRKRFKL